MALRIITWLVSIGVHGAFVAVMLWPTAGGAALEQGAGTDIMMVEQGIALQGVAKLGEDVVSVEAVEAPPIQMAAAQPLEQVEAVEEQQELPVEDVPEVKPVQDLVLASETGPEQLDFKEPEPEEIDKIEPEELVEPVKEELKEPEPEVKEQPLPQQIATVQQETVIAMRESSGEEKKGGSATAHRAYLGKIRTHLERSKVNPRTSLIGTAVVRLTVKADGELVAHRIVKSSGSKLLDNAALASIERAAPFPAIPDEVGEERIEVSVPFKFSVR
jgi:periplasmic protein TonB